MKRIIGHINSLSLIPLVLLVISCAQTPPVRVEEPVPEVESPSLIPFIAPGIPFKMRPEPETLEEEITLIQPVSIPAAQTEESGQNPEDSPGPGETMALFYIEPVFFEPPIRRNRMSVPEAAAAVPVNRIQSPEMIIPEKTAVPENRIVPPIPEYILGQGIMEEESLSGFLLHHNPEAADFFNELAKMYIEEAVIEGVNHDIVFAQMCLETGYLSFGNLVTREQYNFAGLGATGPGQQGAWFPDPRTGVRAHIQHLKAYATDEALKQELVDPRYFEVRFGSVQKISGLAGTWAEDKQYAEKINNILKRLYEFTFLK
jgi:hypothetical protein